MMCGQTKQRGETEYNNNNKNDDLYRAVTCRGTWATFTFFSEKFLDEALDLSAVINKSRQCSGDGPRCVSVLVAPS